MSTQTAVAPTRTEARPTLVAVVLSLSSLIVAAVVLWQPWGKRNAFGYADIAPHRDAAWLGALADGLAVAAAALTLGLAVCLLAPARGRALATIGTVVSTLGGVLFSSGMVAFGALAWFATDSATLSTENGTALLAAMEKNPGHLTAVQMAGFLLFTLGSLILMGALWRARSVPRWLPVAVLVLTVATFATGGVVLNLVEALHFLMFLVVAYFARR